MESELFGHERGAFTGAIRKHLGRIAFADQGTLFIDQIDDLPMNVQAKFLRLIETGEFEPLGSTQQMKIDLRIIATSMENLADRVKKNLFRQDLYFRLAQVEIYIPPLRKRKEDIPFLIRHFLRQNSIKYKVPIPHFTAQAMEVLLNYDWPGNIRELQFFIERLMILRQKSPITVQDVKTSLSHHPEQPPIEKFNLYIRRNFNLSAITSFVFCNILQETSIKQLFYLK